MGSKPLTTAPNPPYPYPPNDPIPCVTIADPPPEVTANLNPQQIENIKAWGAQQRLQGRADLMAEMTALWEATEDWKAPAQEPVDNGGLTTQG